ncbi:MFS transporter [Roseomonas sp. OT10]|uniref:MFS transporter n=1 Tax=Roseomonas cutis TaxID=2897332 RepID=UPI001E3DAE45|nr:MFS transporter [Roseomonas sp. OT10]UFN51065.1 MFS transporter [Roseomonas sp. OT10]
MSATASAPAAPPPLTKWRSATFVAASALLWCTQGLGMNLVTTNTSQIQGALGATLTETSWLIAAYMAPNASLTLLLTKIRTQFGLRRFAEWAIVIFAAASLLHLVARDLNSALLVRFLAGAAAAPLSTLGFLYMLEAFSPAKRLSWGLSLALTCSAATPSLARLLSPALLDLSPWPGFFGMEVGLALMALAVVYLLPLAPVPHAKVLHPLDFVSYPLIALGFGLLTVVLTLGRYVWWSEAPWIGLCLAVAVLALALAGAIEVNREAPLLNLHWLFSPEMIRFTVTLLVFRLVLAEQSAGAVGLFQTLGLLNEQSRLLFGLVLLSSVAGGLCCGLVMRHDRIPALQAVALSCIAVGAFMDGHATSLTRPGDMLLSQSLIAFGGALFLPPAMLDGLTRTMRRGATYMTSFLGIFLFTQNIGGQLGSAAFGTAVILREKFHSSQLVEHLTLADPVVAARVRQLAAAYGHVLTDGRLLNAEGLSLLSQQATREANILAYNDVFLMISALAAGALAILLLRIAWTSARSWLAPPAPAS